MLFYLHKLLKIIFGISNLWFAFLKPEHNLAQNFVIALFHFSLKYDATFIGGNNFLISKTSLVNYVYVMERDFISYCFCFGVILTKTFLINKKNVSY